MNLNCMICTDLLTPNADIYSTPCGHILHYHCLLHWLENSKTCPQCRTKITVKSLIRLYINVATPYVEGDATILQHRLDALEFQLKLKDTDIKNFTDKYKALEEQNKGLRLKVKELEMVEMKHESVMAALKDQIKFFKQKSLSCDKLIVEVNQLKSELKKFENVEVAMSGSRQQVEDLIRNENNVESLALLASTLKKSLVDTDRRKRELRIELKKAQNDIYLHKRNVVKINSEYEDTKRQLESLKLNYHKEITYLKNKFGQLQSQTVLNDSVNDSIRRITSESPVNYNRTPILNHTESKVVDLTNSPVASPPLRSQPIPDSLKHKHSIVSDVVAESPLPASSMGVLAIQRAKMISNSSDQNKFSIFKGKQPLQFERLDVPGISDRKSDVYFDGFGGSSKDDIFPTPQKIPAGLKRPKTSKTTSSKFKKLSADAGKPNRKMSDFF